ncbi:solute carrier family 12 member 6-like protein [Plakobranchus ocellatus]|uniref:Solute carrier family 12 member 6-like protein n=1 Tax=Plakobranchus ocellatus TaxID=259542 RepID=A0AAV3ZH25_9GAST|nr:solute carrier family 12 member 6-like protein [Plakobranchus ocellatus]
MASRKEEEDASVLEPLNPGSGSGDDAPGGGVGRFAVKKVDVDVSSPAADGAGPDAPEPGAREDADIELGRLDEDDASDADGGDTGYSNGGSRKEPEIQGFVNAKGDNSAQHKDILPLAENDEADYDNHMALYEDDLSRQGRISSILNRITTYQAGMAPNVSDVEKGKGKAKANLGTVLGVYLPCIQNIFGVLLFVRMTWIVGMAGALESFGIVLICCTATMLTAFSMSAIATNGVVPAGGSYFMISRALGPEFGGAVGVLFYLGTSVASSMYIIGAVEILVKYMAPQLDLFGDVFHSYRIYGTCVMLVLAFVVFIGVTFVSKFAALSLACVIISILCIYIGIFVANPDRSVE